MTLSTGILTYVMLWVVILFLVLPWGVHLSDVVESGHAPSAPERPRIGLKLLITSGVAGLLWVLLFIARA